MLKYDPIDIFFIVIIGIYFIALVCISITLIILGINKVIKRRKKPIEDKENRKGNSISSKVEKPTFKKVVDKKTTKKTSRKKVPSKKNIKRKKKTTAKKSTHKKYASANKAKRKRT